MTTEVLIGLGANLGRRHRTLEEAVRELDADPGFEVLAVSPWLATDPVGGPADQPWYLNGALRGRTTHGASDLLALLHRIEAAHGRDREAEARHGPRPLDLDLLFFGDATIEEPHLVVPHPRLEDRPFVLEPLAHLVPDRRLPRSARTVRERLAELVGVPVRPCP